MKYPFPFAMERKINMGTSKQDRQGARTVQDMERKYNFGESFAEVYNIATGARSTAEEAKETAKDAKDNPNLDHEAVFNALTEDGKCQGLFRSDDGNVYLNLEYIKSGSYTSTKEVFIEPGYTEAVRIMKHIADIEKIPDNEIPLYDFSGDGTVSVTDAMMAMQADVGMISVEQTLPGAKKTPVTITIDPEEPDDIIKITGTDMWGNSYNKSLGIHSAFLKNTNDGCMFRVVGSEQEWVNPPLESTTEYRTAEKFQCLPVYKKLFEVDFDEAGTQTVSTGISIYDRKIIGISYIFDDSWNVYPQSGANVVCTKGANSYNLNVTSEYYGVCYVEIKYC